MLLELFLEIEEAIRRIERRFSDINSPEDFLCDDNGLDRLDGIAMMLVAIGENMNKLEKKISKKAFDQHNLITHITQKSKKVSGSAIPSKIAAKP
ncbi:hypothetical protein [Pseudanabaena sp. Chao 1811]|uniref:hypothetical protein n=1 Tax=Pseudanabaena sp. Chao 1811 TaxID=2963092 RepID=UPI0022F3EB50|nr:hypothetical protein [Pseudanabaena sp. Chao 1811]